MSALTEAVIQLREHARSIRAAAAGYRQAWTEQRKGSDAFALAVLKLQEAFGPEMAGAPEDVRRLLEGCDEASSASALLVELEMDDGSLRVAEIEACSLEECAGAAAALADALSTLSAAPIGGAA